MVGPKQWVLLLSDALLIFLTFATQNASAQNNQTDPVGLTILGEVILEDSNRPAAGVVVTAKAMENPSTVSVLTNENGVFQLRGLSAKRHELFAEEAGYESSRLTVRPGEAATPLQIYLRKSPA